MQVVQLEREALRRLPAVMAELFHEPLVERAVVPASGGRDVDAAISAAGRRWLIELKTSSSPGTVASAADQLAAFANDSGVAVLVVPFMTPAGAKAADDRSLNWIDLSGNAHLRDRELYVRVQGRPNQFAGRGRPSSAFAPKSSRVARALLLDPQRWWVQKELSEHTDLDPSRISRVVRRLDHDQLLERDHLRLRPRDPYLLLDAWADDYRFDRHDIVTGHLSGSGVDLARAVSKRLGDADIEHGFTGLPAAWALERFARFRLVSVYVSGDPRKAADVVALRRNERGANLQVIGPDDQGVFDGRRVIDGLPCVTPVQVYLDLGHLPERAAEAAEQLRTEGRLWDAET